MSSCKALAVGDLLTQMDSALGMPSMPSALLKLVAAVFKQGFNKRLHGLSQLDDINTCLPIGSIKPENIDVGLHHAAESFFHEAFV